MVRKGQLCKEMLFTVKKGFDGSGGGAENSTWTFANLNPVQNWKLKIWTFDIKLDNEGDNDVDYDDVADGDVDCDDVEYDDDDDNIDDRCFAVCHVLRQVVVVVQRQGASKVP